jgi:hypothetical protein
MNDADPLSYARVRQSVAAALYLRNRLNGDVTCLRAEVARRHDAWSRALRRGDGALAEALAHDRDLASLELARAERDLDEARRDASEAKASFVALHAAVRARARDDLRARARELLITVAAEREVAEGSTR